MKLEIDLDRIILRKRMDGHSDRNELIHHIAKDLRDEVIWEFYRNCPSARKTLIQAFETELQQRLCLRQNNKSK